jgi:FixJ family two-component response regulator
VRFLDAHGLAAEAMIVVTGFPDERVRTPARGAGALCFPTKPVATEDLLACLRAALKLQDGNDMLG